MRSSDISKAVREIYDRSPYPERRLSAASNPQCSLPPFPWITAMWQRSHPPRRILVGGCGTGREAFSLGLQFPEACVIAVDFNARSIAIAKEIQRRNPNVKNVRFVVCDLASSRFYKMAGDRFDFVSCHGVLSYI